MALPERSRPATTEAVNRQKARMPPARATYQTLVVAASVTPPPARRCPSARASVGSRPRRDPRGTRPGRPRSSSHSGPSFASRNAAFAATSAARHEPAATVTSVQRERAGRPVRGSIRWCWMPRPRRQRRLLEPLVASSPVRSRSAPPRGRPTTAPPRAATSRRPRRSRLREGGRATRPRRAPSRRRSGRAAFLRAREQPPGEANGSPPPGAVGASGRSSSSLRRGKSVA